MTSRVAAGERGSVAMLLTAVMVVTGLGAVLVGRVGAVAIARARAEAAADAAALAAADALALGRGSVAAEEAARRVARANGATLTRCDCRGQSAVVTVRTSHSGHSGPRWVSATSRAHIRGVLPYFRNEVPAGRATNPPLRKGTARKFSTSPAS